MILQGKEEIVAEAKRIIDARLGEESSRYSFIPALDDRAALALWQRIVAAQCGIFAVRMNEIFLMSQSRPIRSVHRSEDWTCRSIAEHGMPALKASFYPVVAARPRALDACAHAPSQP
jgi:hypothetical protein